MAQDAEKEGEMTFLEHWYCAFWLAAMTIIAALLLCGCASNVPTSPPLPPITAQMSNAMNRASVVRNAVVVSPVKAISVCADFWWYGANYAAVMQSSPDMTNWTDVKSFTVSPTVEGELCVTNVLPNQYVRAVARYSVGTFTN